MKTQKMLNHVYADPNLTVIIEGKVYQTTKEHPLFKILIECINNNDVIGFTGSFNRNTLPLKVEEKIQTYLSGKCEIREDGNVYYDGQIVDNITSQTIKNLIKDGLPFEPMLKFLDKLFNNTSFRVREQLPKFMKFDGITISEDGCLLTYKAVKDNWWDKWTGVSHHNVVGSTQSMDRGRVNDDPQNACAVGLHAGSLNFVAGYGSGSDHIIIVKVDPADIVCIPYDCSSEKMRVCKYEVVCEYQGKLKPTLYKEGEVEGTKVVEDPKWDDDKDEYDNDDYWSDYNDDEDELDDEPDRDKWEEQPKKEEIEQQKGDVVENVDIQDTLKALLPSQLSEELIELSGKQDALANIDKYNGFKALAKDLKIESHPMLRLYRERYEDGWYKAAIEKNNPTKDAGIPAEDISTVYGVKPTGQKFWNVRGENGCFKPKGSP